MDSVPWPVIGGVIGGLVTLALIAFLILAFISYLAVVKFKRDRGVVREDIQRKDVEHSLEMKTNEAYASVIRHANTHTGEETAIVKYIAYGQITQNSISCSLHDEVVYCEVK